MLIVKHFTHQSKMKAITMQHKIRNFFSHIALFSMIFGFCDTAP